VEFKKKILVVIPAFNEELTIGKVITDFVKYLPEADICVVDNNSTDKTAEIILKTFDELRIRDTRGLYLKEYKKGKAYAVKKAIYNTEADIYIMIDADSTYDVSIIQSLIMPVVTGEADMVVADRHSDGSYISANKRPLHNFGNNLTKKLINFLYRTNLKDILSGYRVFNKDFIDNYPILSKGFELETEITLHALENGYVIREVPSKYVDRPENSVSKLNTLKDGYKVISTIFAILKNYKPLFFFGSLSLIFIGICLALGIPIIVEYIRTGYVNRFPTAFLSMGFGILAFIFITVALILDTFVNFERKANEMERKMNRRKIK
jgi:glycosyltransferase involved in cell wall biosynthesis